VLGGGETQRAVSGVTSLAAQVRVRQQEIEALRRQIEDEKARAATQVTPATLDALTRELEEVRAANAALEKAAAQKASRIAELRQTLGQSDDLAKGRTRTLIKRMLDAVFRETSDAFDEECEYSGRQVSDRLREMLGKHAKASLKEINDNGVI
jgi:predicted  nucleic acid-binding Zn-ribbon protein